jgi:hypothetical protein
MILKRPMKQSKRIFATQLLNVKKQEETRAIVGVKNTKMKREKRDNNNKHC